MKVTKPYVLFNVWIEPFASSMYGGPASTVWAVQCNGPHDDHREDDWVGLMDGSPLSVALIALGGWMQRDEDASDDNRSRYVLTREEFEGIVTSCDSKEEV